MLDGKQVVVYEVAGDNSMVRAAGTFSCETHLVGLYEQNAYTIEPGKVQVRTFQVRAVSCQICKGGYKNGEGVLRIFNLWGWGHIWTFTLV